MVQTRCAESSYGTVGHCLAPCDGPIIFEIEHNIRFRGSMKAFGVPSCRNPTLLADTQTEPWAPRREGPYAPIFVRRLSSSALRLKNPAGFAAMHLAVGIISGALNWVNVQQGCSLG